MDQVIRTEGLTKYYGKARGIIDVDLEVVRRRDLRVPRTERGRQVDDHSRAARPDPADLGASAGPRARRPPGPARDRSPGQLPAGELAFYEDLTGTQTLEFLGNLRGAADRAYRRRPGPAVRARSVARRSRACPAATSRRSASSAAFQDRPELLILDEPTSGLDPFVQLEFEHLATAMREEGSTLFVSSHILPEVEHLCDRVGIIREGRLLAVESIATLKERAIQRLEIDFGGPVDATAFDGVSGVRDLTVEDGTPALHGPGQRRCPRQAGRRLRGPQDPQHRHEPRGDLPRLLRHRVTRPAMLLRNVFTKTLRDLRWPTFWTGLSLFAIAGYFTLLYPTYSKTFDLESLLAKIPPAMRAMIGGQFIDVSSANRVPQHRAVPADPAGGPGRLRDRPGERAHGRRGVARDDRRAPLVPGPALAVGRREVRGDRHLRRPRRIRPVARCRRRGRRQQQPARGLQGRRRPRPRDPARPSTSARSALVVASYTGNRKRGDRHRRRGARRHVLRERPRADHREPRLDQGALALLLVPRGQPDQERPRRGRRLVLAAVALVLGLVSLVLFERRDLAA